MSEEITITEESLRATIGQARSKLSRQQAAVKETIGLIKILQDTLDDFAKKAKK